MFSKSPDERLSIWSDFRKELETSSDPLNDLISFWKDCPFIPYNRKVDPFNQYNWPTPWEIIVENRYDDFTKALMMSWTLKLTDRFKTSRIEIKTYTDRQKPRGYNLVFVNDDQVVNYNDNFVVDSISLPEHLILENVLEIQRPR